MRGFSRNLASASLAGLAAGSAMQGMDDRAEGEVPAAGKVQVEDFVCAPMPTNGCLLNSGSFTIFEATGEENMQSQQIIAGRTISPVFQKTLNFAKGQIQPRMDGALEDLGICAQRACDDPLAAIETETLVTSIAHLVAAPRSARGELVTQLFNSDMRSQDAANSPADVVSRAT